MLGIIDTDGWNDGSVETLGAFDTDGLAEGAGLSEGCVLGFNEGWSEGC